MNRHLFLLTVILGLFAFGAHAGDADDSDDKYVPIKVSSGQYFSCALFSNGRVKCWGKNDKGQLGQGDTVDRGDNAGEMGSNLPFINLGSKNGKYLKADDIQSGVAHVCAIIGEFRVKCWGWNASGQLGLGDTNNRGDSANEMGNNLPYVDLGKKKQVKMLALGERFTCALLADNTMKCWGDNAYGQLGRGNTTNYGDAAGEMGDNLPIVNFGSGSDKKVKSIAAGHYHVCALLASGDVKCWGLNDFGQLGLGDTNARGDGPGEMGDSLPVVNLGSKVEVDSLSAGTSHTCALMSDKRLKCWGDNFAGQLGLGSTKLAYGTSASDMGDNLPFVNLGSLSGSSPNYVLKVQVGFFQTCALLTNFKVKCWGNNGWGQLGLGHTNDDATGLVDGFDPVSIGAAASSMGDNLPYVNLGTGVLVRSMSSDYGSTCAILANNKVKCWGINGSGALGLGDTTNRGSAASQMGDNLAAVDVLTSISTYTESYDKTDKDKEKTRDDEWGWND